MSFHNIATPLLRINLALRCTKFNWVELLGRNGCSAPLGVNMLLSSYLGRHFVDKAAFAVRAGISVERLEALLLLEAIPCATYVCDGVSISSSVFGKTPINEPLHGEYFRPENTRWVVIAHAAPAGYERQTVLSKLTEELKASLVHYGLSEADIESRITDYLPYFYDGTFGLCVADPSTGAGIVKKEMLQEKLIEMTDNGKDVSSHNGSEDELLELIGLYADSAMPFSPAEYERSSRKRLVDDLRSRLAASAQNIKLTAID